MRKRTNDLYLAPTCRRLVWAALSTAFTILIPNGFLELFGMNTKGIYLFISLFVCYSFFITCSKTTGLEREIHLVFLLFASFCHFLLLVRVCYHSLL
jgi:hypothetical protein